MIGSHLIHIICRLGARERHRALLLPMAALGLPAGPIRRPTALLRRRKLGYNLQPRWAGLVVSEVPGLVGMSEQWAGVPVTRPIVYSFLFPAGDSLIPVDALAAGWPRFLDEPAAPFPTFLY